MRSASRPSPVTHNASLPSDSPRRIGPSVVHAPIGAGVIVIGLALVFVAARYLPWIYQTLPLLLVAYLIRFVPEAVGVNPSRTIAALAERAMAEIVKGSAVSPGS